MHPAQLWRHLRMLRLCAALRTATIFVSILGLWSGISQRAHAGASPQNQDRSYHRLGPKPNPRVKMVIEKRGTIVVELYKKECPETTTHFLSLVNRKFYDRTLFHNVVRGFMATAGDPKSKTVDGAKIATLSSYEVATRYGLGGGGSGKTVKLEAHAGHDKGTIGLQHGARSIDSGDSQFFFNLDDNHTNDGAYTVFGKITQGINVMDNIKQGDRILTIRVVPLAQ